MRPKSHLFSVLSPSVPVSFSSTLHSRTDFYREEFLKHRACLEQQREYFSERAITAVDGALKRILAELDQLCSCEDADSRVSDLLAQFDLVTRVSTWIDPKTLH
jgi:hypothetical protein